jgi:hypothetical protein
MHMEIIRSGYQDCYALWDKIETGTVHQLRFMVLRDFECGFELLFATVFQESYRPIVSTSSWIFQWPLSGVKESTKMGGIIFSQKKTVRMVLGGHRV